MTEKIKVDIEVDPSGMKEGFSDGMKGFDDFSNSGKKMADSLTMSAKQTAFAMRMIPAQFTDIVTQLAGGQDPLTIMIQQGGQLKDMFGGIGPAFKAMGEYVVGLISPANLLAAGVGVLTYAFIEGSRESENFTKSLILSGNAAGTNAGQLQSQAYQLAATTSATHGAAADTLNKLAESGKVSAAVLTQTAKAAIDLEEAGGPAINTTIKAFIALGTDPVTAVLKLNDQIHFLTGSVYEQIKVLSDQGRAAEAAALAQTAYADAVEKQIPGLVATIGSLEAAWKGLTGVAKGAWDAMMGFGREVSLDAQIAVLDKEIATRKKADQDAKDAKEGKAVKKEYHSWEIDKSSQLSGESLESLEKQRRVLTSIQSTQTQMALAAQRENEINTADLFISKKKEDSLSKQEKLKREIAAIRENAAVAGTSQDVVDSLIKSATEKYAEHKKKVNDDFGELMNRLSGLDSNYGKELDTLYSAFQKGTLGIDEYRLSVERLIAKQPFAVKAAQDEKKAQEEQIKMYEATLKAEERAGKAITDFRVKTGDQVEAIQRQIELLGKTPEQAAQINAFANIDRQASALLLKLQELRGEVIKRGGDTSGIDDLIDKLPQLANLAKGDASTALVKLKDAQDQLNASWEYGTSEALRKYLDEVSNVAAKTENLMTSAFHGMDDALTDFVVKGKGDFSSLAESIISDLVRMQIQASVTGPLAAAMQNAGGLSGIVSGLFGSSSNSGAAQEAGVFVGSAKGNVFSGAPDLHQYVNTVQTSPKVFGFDRMHAFAKGGIFAEENPEAVMPLARDANGRLGVSSSGSVAPKVNITINNQGATDGYESTVQTKTNDSGGIDVDVLVAKAVQSDIRKNGPITQSFAQLFGLRQAV